MPLPSGAPGIPGRFTIYLNIERDARAALSDLKPERLAVLVGAGISVASPTRLPTAMRFLQMFYELCLPSSCDCDLLLNADLRFELVLAVLQHRFDPELDVLALFSEVPPNRNHMALADLARRGALILTTNFDLCLERALASSCVRVRAEIEDFEEYLRHGGLEGPEVWHLHGALSTAGANAHPGGSVVASIRDCWRSKETFRLNQSKGAALSRVLAERDLLVLGYSGSDDYDIAPALEEIRSSRLIVWVQHASPDGELDLANGVTPLVVSHSPDGRIWYHAGCANSLAAILARGMRHPASVHLVSHPTQLVLAAFEQDDIHQGGRHEELLDEEQAPFSAGLAEWRREKLPHPLDSYLLAILLCDAGGLWEEKRRILAESSDQLGRGAKEANVTPALIRTIYEILAAQAEEMPVTLVIMQTEFHRQVVDQDPALQALLATIRGRALERANQVSEAIAEFRKSLDLRRSIGMTGDLEVAEHDLARALFLAGYPTGDLGEATERVCESLRLSEAASHPEGIARSRILLGRIEERRGHSGEAFEHYEHARDAAFRSGLDFLIAEAAGEMGLSLWTAVIERTVEYVASLPMEEAFQRMMEVAQGATPEVPEDARGEAEKAAILLAEAFRIHDQKRQWRALAIVGSNLADCLSALGQTGRGLVAHCAAFRCLDPGDEESIQIALVKIRAGSLLAMPDLEFGDLEGEALVDLVQREALDREWRI